MLQMITYYVNEYKSHCSRMIWSNWTLFTCLLKKLLSFKNYFPRCISHRKVMRNGIFRKHIVTYFSACLEALCTILGGCQRSPISIVTCMFKWDTILHSAPNARHRGNSYCARARKNCARAKRPSWMCCGWMADQWPKLWPYVVFLFSCTSNTVNNLQVFMPLIRRFPEITIIRKNWTDRFFAALFINFGA